MNQPTTHFVNLSSQPDERKTPHYDNFAPDVDQRKATTDDGHSYYQVLKECFFFVACACGEQNVNRNICPEE